MRDEWAEAFAAGARTYWTTKKTESVTSGKRMEILPGEAPVLLRALGLLHRDTSMPPSQVRKYRQINHMVTLMRPPLLELISRYPRLHILDAGCGRSYLTTLLAWCFKHTFKHSVQILGVDRNSALIKECRRRTRLTLLDDVLRYVDADLNTFSINESWDNTFDTSGGPAPLHAIISLHACDTATDNAIAIGLRNQVELIAVAPCCQAELNRKWAALSKEGAAGAFGPIWSAPHLRQRTAATITDTFRTLLLKGAGYNTATMEFVSASHSAKNTLIRAIKRRDLDPDALRQYVALKNATGGAGITLEDNLPSHVQACLKELQSP